MEGSASVRKSLSGTLVPSSVSTVALLQKPEENTGKISRKVLDEEEYIEVSTSLILLPLKGVKECKPSNTDASVTFIHSLDVHCLLREEMRYWSCILSGRCPEITHHSNNFASCFFNRI